MTPEPNRETPRPRNTGEEVAALGDAIIKRGLSGQELWDASAELFSSTDPNKIHVEEAVLDVVIGLNALGAQTYMACEGHPGRIIFPSISLCREPLMFPRYKGQAEAFDRELQSVEVPKAIRERYSEIVGDQPLNRERLLDLDGAFSRWDHLSFWDEVCAAYDRSFDFLEGAYDPSMETEEMVELRSRMAEDYLLVERLVEDFNTHVSTESGEKLGIVGYVPGWAFDLTIGSASRYKEMQEQGVGAVVMAEIEAAKELSQEAQLELLRPRQEEMRRFGEYLKRLVLSSPE